MTPKLRCANCDSLNDPWDVVCIDCGWPITDDADTEQVDDSREWEG